MDLLDKSIVMELMTNSRVSCQELAERYNSTRGVVRKRIKKLEKRGVIREYSLWYSLAMTDAEFVFGHIRVNQQMKREDTVKHLVQNPMIHAVIPSAKGDILFHANVVGSDGLSSLGSSIRQLDNIDEVELHLIQTDRGQKVELKKIHFNVLSALFYNSRISVAEIARRTKLSPRRVKRVLDEIISGKGIVFTIARNPAQGSGVSFYNKIRWDERQSSAEELLEKIARRFPSETWESYVSASDPVSFTRFSVEHIKGMETVTNELSNFDEIEALETLVFFPARITSILTRGRLGMDIKKAGFELCHY